MKLPRPSRLVTAALGLTLAFAVGCRSDSSMGDLGHKITSVFDTGPGSGPQAISVKVPYKGKEVERMVAASGDADCKKGVDYLSVGRPKEAKASFELATQKKPTDHLAWYGHGVACELLEDNGLAAKSYESAVMACKDELLKEAFSTALRQAKTKAGLP